MERQTVSVRLSSEEKEAILKIGNGSLSSGIRKILNFYKENLTLSEDLEKDPFVLRIRKMEKALDQMDNEFWTEVSEHKSTIVIL